ncbi:MAG TPA: hypothetical protein VGK67_16655 [Myxococcales bacterium]|jgi:hypothetical protein
MEPTLPAPNSAPKPSSDLDTLKVLAIFHYVLAGLSALGGGFFLLYAALGGFLLRRSDLFTGGGRNTPPPPPFVGALFIGLGVGLFAAGLAFAVAIAVAGRSLSRQVRYVYCLVVAGFCCLLTPYGTVLGVFTIVVLMRPGVKALFGRPP